MLDSINQDRTLFTRSVKESHTYHRRALGRGVKGSLFVVPDAVFESPKEYIDVIFSVRKDSNPRESRRAVVTQELWVDDTTYISLRIL